MAESGKNGETLNKHHHHHSETHGLRSDIDEGTSMADVKAPNVFERAKEEIEALVEAIHSKKEHKTSESTLYDKTRDSIRNDHLKSEKLESNSGQNGNTRHHHHHSETHGLRDDIDEKTSITDVKAPNVFERAKEEIEALVEAIQSKKESKTSESTLYDKTRDSTGKDHLKSEKSESNSGQNGKSLNNNKHHHHQSETHGLRSDIYEGTSMTDVKAPNVFERAKEEIEALVEAIHPKKEPKASELCDYKTRDSTRKDHLKSEKSGSNSDKNEKKVNIIVKAKEEIESLIHKPHHHKETHGMSDDIDENTPNSEVKGPNVFERAKEEIEALIEAIHPKKDSNDVLSPKEGR